MSVGYSSTMHRKTLYKSDRLVNDPDGVFLYDDPCVVVGCDFPIPDLEPTPEEEEYLQRLWELSEELENEDETLRYVNPGEELVGEILQNGDACPYSKLLTAMIEQAVQDINLDDPNNAERRRTAQRAVDWIFSEERGLARKVTFCEACDYLGCDPEVMRSGIAKNLALLA